MKPAKLRQLLSEYGEIGRIYCTPEDAAARQMRKRKGGNSGALDLRRCCLSCGKGEGLSAQAAAACQ